MLRNISRSIIRASAFLRKEVFEILRQPRLVFTLVLGPFLILLIFGIGYRNEAPALRTIFVVEQPDSQLAQQIEEYASSLGPQLVYMGVTPNSEEAIEKLRRGEVDLVAVAPSDAYNTIRSNQQAVFTLFHREIDPFQIDYVNYFGQAYVDEVNRRVLRSITEQGQSETSTLQDDLREARESASALNNALRNNDNGSANQHQASLNQNIDSVSLAVGASLGVLSGVQQTLGGSSNNSDAEQVLAALANIQQSNDELNQTNDNQTRIERVSQIEQELTTLENSLQEFQNIDPQVLVSPFRSETKTIAAIQPTPPSYFAPAVIALLLQHLAVTFAALSIVRERTVGTMELFRVSPLSAAETLFGKYISYMIFGGIIAAVLTLLLVFVLKYPMLGDWNNFAIVVTVVLFTSLGIGFVISILSQTDSQAVQYTMIILLTSVFFSGFLMRLESLWEPVRVVSWMLPTTYGSILLRDITLRGEGINIVLLGGLLAIGLVMCLLAWLMLRRLISKARR